MTGGTAGTDGGGGGKVGGAWFCPAFLDPTPAATGDPQSSPGLWQGDPRTSPGRPAVPKGKVPLSQALPPHEGHSPRGGGNSRRGQQCGQCCPERGRDICDLLSKMVLTPSREEGEVSPCPAALATCPHRNTWPGLQGARQRSCRQRRAGGHGDLVKRPHLSLPSGS